MPSMVIGTAIAALVLCGAASLCAAEPAEAPRIIFDTDMDSDFDDAGALATLHALADLGECEILAVMHSTSTPWSVGVIDAINTWYGRPHIPVGDRMRADNDNRSAYAKAIATNTERFGHNITDLNHPDVVPALDLYKRILSAQPDHSVTVVTVGPYLNLLDLMNDPEAVELVRRKVKLLSIMGGHFNPPGHTEWNLSQKGRYVDGPLAGKAVVERWPTPVMWSDVHIGVQVRTGARMRDAHPDNPVREAYRMATHERWFAHSSWDQTSVLYAVRGLGDTWTAHTTGYPVIYEDESGNWASDWREDADSDHAYLKFKKGPAEIARIIEGLMVAPPAHPARKPVSVILDTDVESDFDDAGAVALLHAFADNGEAEILAMGVSATSPLPAPCLSAFNAYYGRGGIPIGVVKGEGARQWPSPYNQTIVDEFSHGLESAEQAPDAAELYRKVLAEQPDNSVVMITIGFLTNMKNLLQTEGDDHSPLDGRSLVAKKVRAWVCMGGPSLKAMPEHNLAQDWGSSVYSIENWPTPIVFAPFELGLDVKTGPALRTAPTGNPIRRAYEVSNGLKEHASFDQIAVYHAVRYLDAGVSDMWEERRGAMGRHANGDWEWTPSGGDHICLFEKMDPAAVSTVIDRLMAQPAAAAPRRPAIEKLGTIDVDLVETTPIVFKGKLYRFEYVRQGYWDNDTGDSYFRFIDHETGAATPSFGAGYHLGSAFVDDGRVIVSAVNIWDGERIDLFVSEDLETWSHWNALDLPGYGLFNTSLCRAGDQYVLMFEVGKPAEVAGNPFTARFATSADLKAWQLTPPECTYSKDRYTAPHALRYHKGYCYNFYLESVAGTYEMRVVRSRDLVHWQSSPLNPVLQASDDDRRLANDRLPEELRERVRTAVNLNNSDIDFCEFDGRTIINYSWGNQQGVEHLAEAVYHGTVAGFLEGWFPGE